MTPNPANGKVWVVLFLDGNEGLSHLHTFTFDSDMAAIDAWAKEKIAADKAIFSKNPENKSLAQRYVVYGSEVDKLHLLRETSRLETHP
jgi:hypothetical protein